MSFRLLVDMKSFVIIAAILTFGSLTEEVNAFRLKLDAQAAGEDFKGNLQYTDFHQRTENVENVQDEKGEIPNPFIRKEKLPSLDGRCIHPYGFCSFIHF